MPTPRTGLSLASRMILEHLHTIAQASGSESDPLNISMVELAEDLSISQRTVSRSLRQLQDATLISFQPGKGQRPTRVWFLADRNRGDTETTGQGVNPDD